MKNQKKVAAKKATIPGEWLYLSKEGCSVRQIANELEKDYELEIWEDAGVLEIMLAQDVSMDVEHVKIHPKDEITHAFVEQEGYEEVFLVTFVPEEYQKAERAMQQIMGACGGMFCGDTEDFSPVVKNTFSK